MRELTASEIQEIGGGDQIDDTLGLIAAIGAVAAIINAPAAAAFAAGVAGGGYLVKWIASF